MKIAILGTFLGEKTSGAEISSYLLAKGLAESEKVFIVTRKLKEKMPCKAYSLPMAGFMPHNVLMIGTPCCDFYMYRKILSILKKEKPDIVHMQDFSIMIPAVKAAKKLGIPSVMTVRDFRFECNVDCFDEKGNFVFNASKKQYRQFLKKTLGKKAWLSPVLYPYFYNRKNKLSKFSKKIDYFVSVSDFVKGNLMKFGIEKDKITTIHVPKPEWKPEPKKTKKTTIFTAGLLVKAKGFQTIIKAFDIISKNTDAELRIAGTGSYEKQLKELALKLGLKDRIQILGKISYEQIKNEYFNSDFVLQASIVPESLSRIIFEAFSAKKPIIAADSGGNKELVINGKNGYLVPKQDFKAMADKMQILIKNPKLAKKMGLAGYKLIQTDNAKNITARHIKLYKRIK
ncbi:glycosyltransferase family 4 protein [Candidatus Woesearchaeota archaeon]|nr:glycosyltransferase family 4 protein [Candidatus Woesearchaeota archaeon]